MKFEKLTDNKIKIFLSLEDINDNHLSKNLLFSSSFISQNLLHLFLDRANNELNFSVNDENLIVEVLSLNDGFVFTITKIVPDNVEYNCSKVFYEFKSFDDFLDFCTYLKNLDFSIDENFSLLKYNSYYYLTINTCIPSQLHYVLCEFSEKINYSLRI